MLIIFTDDYNIGFQIRDMSFTIYIHITMHVWDAEMLLFRNYGFTIPNS